MVTRGRGILDSRLARDGLLLLLPVVLSVPFWAMPVGRDQGYFSYGGWRMLHGELPHRDFWTNTFPGVFWWYMLMEGVAVVPRAAWNGVLIGVTSVLLSHLGTRRGGLWAGVGYGVVCPLLHRFWDIGQAEHLVNLFIAAGLRTPRALLRGVLLGSAILSKPVALLFAPILAWRSGLGRADTCRCVGGVALGAAIPLTLWLGLYAVSGGLLRVWEDLVIFNAGYGASTWKAELAGRVVRGVARWGAPLWPAVVIAGSAVVRRKGFMGLWLLCALGAVILQGKLFTYHWIIVLAPLMALFGRGVGELRAMGSVLRVIVLFMAIGPWLASPGLLSAAWYPAAYEAWRGIRYLGGAISSDIYLAGFGDKASGADFSAAEQRRAADEIIGRGCGTALVWGFEPGLNYLSRTPNPMRYVADFPLTFPTTSPREVSVQKGHRARFIQEFIRKRPGCVVIVHGDVNPVEAMDSYGQMREFTEFASVLRREYRGPFSIGSYDLWEAR
ncbi:hypothetical protein JXA88_02235 [Candidatus Fermentibacteria bacterium]|nr:hypothetical protein [Candidatus Fermentibacteria bacterium]